jgi:hypothetical protein
VVELSKRLACALSSPAVEGLNVKLTVQLLPTASVLGATGHVLVSAKSPLFAPVIVILLMVSAVLPVLFINAF